MGGGVAEQLWRAVAVFRIAALVYAAALVGANHEHYARPGLGWVRLPAVAARGGGRGPGSWSRPADAGRARRESCFSLASRWGPAWCWPRSRSKRAAGS